MQDNQKHLFTGPAGRTDRHAAENCLFCQIVRGEVESYRVFEDSVSLAFLDHRPLFPGHCLLLPKQHYQTLPDLPVELIAPLFLNAQLLCRAVETAMQAEGSFAGINNRISQSVPHMHIHIVPRRRKDGLRGFFWPRTAYSNPEDALQAQRAIQAAVASLRGAS